MTTKRKLQVFVSSTFTDLKEERQAAVAAILKAGHIPAGMELFTAGDVSQMDTIKEWIDESDVYMLILGGRYGTVESATNLSYTELEYDYAKEQGKAIFAVVSEETAIEEKVKKYGSAFIEKDNSKALAEFRKKVLSNISSFFNDTKDIKLCVYESLADFASKRHLKGWISAGDVPDAKLLNHEVESLRQENATLRAELGKIRTIGEGQQAAKNRTPNELIDLLVNTEVKVPSDVAAGGEAFTTDLLDLATQYVGALVNGVTNAAGSSKLTTFLYFNVMPKLQLFGLAINEAVPDVRYRRSALNSEGREFFAFVAQQQILGKNEG